MAKNLKKQNAEKQVKELLIAEMRRGGTAMVPMYNVLLEVAIALQMKLNELDGK